MRRRFLIAGPLLLLLAALPGYAQDAGSTVSGNSQDVNLPYNLHIGGGIGNPVSTTANFAGIGGTFQIGAGPNLSKHNSIVGEFMWHGLPPNRLALLPIVNPPGNASSLSTSNNLYALTANYMFHIDGHRYGFYLMGGGGWYYRHLALNNITVAPGTVCQPLWNWWGYACQGGFVSTDSTLATRGVSSGGLNGGGGITINLGEGGTRFYIEARYHYSPQGGRISTQIVPVTFGLPVNVEIER